MITNNNDQYLSKQVNSLFKFCVRTIVLVTIVMCVGVLMIDSLKLVSSEDIDTRRFKIDRYTQTNMKSFEDFVLDNENTIKEYVTLIEKELATDMDKDYISVNLILDEYAKESDAIVASYLGLESKDMILSPKQYLPDSYDPTARDWYKSTLENGISWDEMYPDAFTGKFIITLSAPVMDLKTGDLLGVIGVDIEMDELLSQVNDWYITDRGYYIIIDKSATVLNHPNNDLIGMHIPIYEIKKFVLRGDVGWVEYEWDGEEQLADIFYYSPLKISFVHIDYKPTSKWLPINLGFIAVFFLGMILMLILFMQKMNWLKKQISDGDMMRKESYDMGARSVNQAKIKGISEELRLAASKLDELS